MTTMSITRALTRAKTIEKQLARLVESQFVVTLMKREVDDVSDVYQDNLKMTQSNFDQFNDLFAELNNIKAAVRKSNEVTKVVIGGEELTVADALVYKNTIVYRNSFLDRITRENRNAESRVEQSKISADTKFATVRENLIKNSQGQDVSEDYLKTVLTEEERRLKKAIVEVKVSGINNVNEYIEAERKRIDTFLEEVDYVLSESNATTIIEF
nr:MAG TPA: septicolysin [Caudoviricetes sp.]